MAVGVYLQAKWNTGSMPIVYNVEIQGLNSGICNNLFTPNQTYCKVDCKNENEFNRFNYNHTLFSKFSNTRSNLSTNIPQQA